MLQGSLEKLRPIEEPFSFDRLRPFIEEETMYLARVGRLLASKVIIIDEFHNKKLEEVVKDDVKEEGSRNDCSARCEDEDLSKNATSTMY
jgi:hypothetical protein